MKREKVFWGVFFIVAAIFLIVSGMGIWTGIGFWSLALTVLFAATLIKSIKERSWTGIFFSIALLMIVYDKPLGITEITPWIVLLAALLLSIGFGILFGHKHHDYSKFVHVDSIDEDAAFIGFAGTETVEDVTGEILNFDTHFGSSIKYVNSENFQVADVTCKFGAMKMYFDNAKVPAGKALIDLNVSFAVVELFIPKEWNIDNRISASFGALEEKNRNMPDGSVTLTIRGNLSFAGATVIYV